MTISPADGYLAEASAAPPSRRQRGGGLGTFRAPLAPLLVAALLVQTVACSTRQKWEGGPILSRPEVVEQEFGPFPLEELPPLPMPNIPMPTGLRPCCAFGAALRVELGLVPIPLFALTNVIGVADLGPHQYDHGVLSFHQGREGGEPLTSERNGLVYTCRGGFVDTAHLRDWADWTLFLTARIAGALDSGTTIDLSSEGGERRIVIHPVEPGRLAQYGRLALAVPLAQWLAFQLSLWHEIATWYGWSSSGFTEQVSAFSLEDLYSNLLGIKTAAVLIYQSAVTSEAVYNENMNIAIPRLLQRLGAVSGETGRMAMRSVDGIWWDSRVRLPSSRLVLRRYLDHDRHLSPWLVERAWRSSEDVGPAVAEACGGTEQPLRLKNPDSFAGVAFRTQARLEIRVSADLAARMPLPDPASARITQDDFSTIVNYIRVEIETEFGVGATRPDPP